MKKILALILLSIAAVSCYDNYIYDFTYTGIYFPYQMDVRTFVVGEGMKFEVGAALGGVRKNEINRSVSFTLDNSLITAAQLSAMKSASLPYTRRTNVVAARFENMLFGNYWHGGAALVNRPGLSDTTIVYRWAVNDIASKVWTLSTAGPGTLYANGYGNASSSASANELRLVLKGTKVFVSSAPGASNTYLPDGASTFNRSKLLQERKIFLKYQYVDGGNTYHCTDTLYFRNRIRDGVNEWQDENPSDYTK